MSREGTLKKPRKLYVLDPKGSATIVGEYRYNLFRWWTEDPADTRFVNFIMLNPSTADATQDDPTIRRCVHYAYSWGYSRMVVTNLFALRSTDPKVLMKHRDPVGPENDQHLVHWARSAALVVCAWGNEAPGKRADRVWQLLAGVPLHYLRLNETGHPAHPLYLPANLRPLSWALTQQSQ